MRFEHYDFPDGVQEGDLHIAGGLKAAWFRDENILNVLSAAM